MAFFGKVLSSVLLLFSTAFAADLKVGLVLDRGGKDDRSFNASAYRGAMKAKSELGIQIKDVEASDDTLFEPAMKSFIDKKFDLIVGIGVAQAQALKQMALKYPQQKFAIVDADINLPNVRSLLFSEHEGSYLMGAIAALKAPHGVVGFIGGVDIPLIRRFQMGFEQGARSVNASIRVETNYIGATSEAWANPTKAKELAQIQYQKGADVIFVAAGKSNYGVFDAAEQNKRLAIGVDSNQNDIKPGFILTSMLKRVDLAVFETIQSLQKGQFQGGKHVYNVRDGGVDWVLDENNQKLFSEKEKAEVLKVREKLAQGKISVKDYYSKASN